MKKLSVILPAYNEGMHIEENVRRLKKEVDALNIPYEIIVVNDGSKDDTLQKAQRCASENVKVLSYDNNSGKGYAVGHGMLNSVGEYKLFMDVDLSTSLEAIEEFLDLMQTGRYDMLIGNRKSYSSRQQIKQPLYRRFFGKGFTLLSSLLVGYTIDDFTCGFKMYKTDAADIIFKRQRIFDWAFDAELIYIAVLHHLRIREVSVTWRHYGGSKVRLVRDIIRSLYGLMIMRINALRGFYK